MKSHYTTAQIAEMKKQELADQGIYKEVSTRVVTRAICRLIDKGKLPDVGKAGNRGVYYIHENQVPLVLEEIGHKTGPKPWCRNKIAKQSKKGNRQ